MAPLASVSAHESLMCFVTNAALVFSSLGRVLLLLVLLFDLVDPSLGLGASLSYIICFLAEHEGSYLVQ